MRRLASAVCRLLNLAVPLSHLLYGTVGLVLLAPRDTPAQQFPCCGGGTANVIAVVGPPEHILRSTPHALAVARIGLTVSDMERSLAFYTGTLQFRVVADTEVAGASWESATGIFGVRLRRVTLELGRERLELTEFLAASRPGLPAPVDSRSNDRWFQHVAIITSDMDSAYRLLRVHRVRSASTAPQLLPASLPNAAGIRAFYFRDPDGHPLEVLQFPADKGDPRWQARGALFLGIDHTAIVVASTERSLAFYRDQLGMRVAGGSENFGTEQEHLNNVEGAHLRITALRAPAGPGVELLEYLFPRDGRPYPDTERPNDLVHWQTVIQVEDPALVAAQLVRGGATILSRLQPGNRPVLPGVLLRDPDGHVIELVTP
jgi:catechol 2,3-dioxygenase-like lactoylglutathione lyase family enzyme